MVSADDDDDVGEGGHQMNGESAVDAKHPTSLLSADEFEHLQQLNEAEEDGKKSFEEQSDSGSSLASEPSSSSNSSSLC